MKPFNLQDALAGKPVQTRDGRPVKIAYNSDAPENLRILGWFNIGWGIWFEDGGVNKSHESPLDLFMSPEKREVWVCLYRVAGTLYTTAPCSTEQEAIKHASASKAEIITTVKIWEEEI